jgi:uncharacterized protein (DUF1501 family)
MMNRRNLLKYLSAAGTVGVGTGLGMMSLNSQSTSMGPYKALVVIHLNGGNDANDMLVPMDGAYSDYQKSRPSIAVPKKQPAFFEQPVFWPYPGHQQCHGPFAPFVQQWQIGLHCQRRRFGQAHHHQSGSQRHGDTASVFVLTP